MLRELPGHLKSELSLAISRRILGHVPSADVLLAVQNGYREGLQHHAHILSARGESVVFWMASLAVKMGDTALCVGLDSLVHCGQRRRLCRAHSVCFR